MYLCTTNYPPPDWLSHKPVVYVDYEHQDADAGDAKYLSIGRASWNSDDFSAKVLRWASEGERWSRQSEELPLWRVLDLATLLVAIIQEKESNLSEVVKDEKDFESLRHYLRDNMSILKPKLSNLQRLFNSSKAPSDISEYPNIFSFATSELSQDAMIAWLIEWADEKYESIDSEMHRIGKDFLLMLLGKNEDFEIRQVNVCKQWQRIDVLVEINGNIVLVIEDKTTASNHNKQLQRYKEAVEEEYHGKNADLCYAYVKTGNEPLSKLREIEELGYRTINRTDILKCLSTYSGNNFLILQYRLRLQKIEEDTMEYKTLPVKEWGWDAWEGFYMELENRLNIICWEYVPNPNGGFLGAWWHYSEMKDGTMYLQFEQGNLCFKIGCESDRDRSEVRDEQHKKLMRLAHGRFPEIHRPNRFGRGYYMTIAVVDEIDVFGEGTVNFEALTTRLKTYQSLIDECCVNQRP